MGAIDAEELRLFLNARVKSTIDFQVGCIMEPTLDRRLADLLLIIARSPAKPTGMFMLQTNGILLHRHDLGKMRDAGLTQLSVSVDAAEPETQRELRNGTSLDRVIENIAAFRNGYPEAKVNFITTVTSVNVRKMRQLVALGLEFGVRDYVFREVFYYPDNGVVDHARMPGLLLKDNQFAVMREELIAEFGNTANFFFADQDLLSAGSEKMAADALLG